MPIEFGLWRIDDNDFQRLSSGKLNDESRLEKLLIEDPNMLGRDLLIVGQQIRTASGNRLDLLGIDADGDLHIIELKRDRTPRDVVAQALDYASWVRQLTYDDITDIHDDFDDTREFEEAFGEKFSSARPEGASGVPEDINQTHSLTIVASELDAATERIVEYLAEEYSVPVNAVRFNYYQDDGREYIGRTWLIDPQETPEPPSKREAWNGRDYYASFGHGKHRSWSDAREYGFISGGQGEWYSRTLDQLSVDDRIFVHIPKRGYVGVGTVTKEKTPVGEFEVETDDGTKSILDVDIDAEAMDENVEDEALREYLVGVEWIDDRPLEEAYWETGMYANQNTVTKLRNQFSLERLYQHFDVDE
ncbi:endonuclease NucS domain-containing protein [Halomicroarcula sp. GCM10025709]|uniref:endonuclease NucS domain-containing protein n=1 Tax=Haloarcula TaxID=2237 RepID=UPI0024C2113C|nr:endonuclease NucS domain-containing protein [Halomicroarcula sp. YJ-61-S]